MNFANCKNLQDFEDYFNEITKIKLSNLSPYNTVVSVIYDTRSYNHMHIFLALYRSVGYIDKIESQEIESQFELYISLKYR